MSTALNTVYILLFLGLGFLYFIGLGWLIMELLFHQDSICGHENILLLRKIPLGITLGLIANYGVSLLFQSLSIGLTIGATISIVGTWRFLSSCLRSIKCNKESSNKWVGIIFICLLYISPILLNPLYEWDARSIWFFHAKMIYSAGSFSPSAGWQHPSVVFSHVDYPKLVPGMAAQVTHILGYWNEYIPKISLVFLLVPAVMWLFNFACKSFSFVYLLLLFPFSLSGLIWNGYMDGYLSIYLLISMLLFGRYIQHNELIDLISGMICLILLLYLKNEGQLAVLVGTIALVFVDFLLKKDGHRGIKFHILNRRCAVVGAIVLLPFVVWNVYKMNYGLSNDLQINTVQSVNRAIERLNDNAYSLIINNTYNQVESSLLLFGLLYFALIAQKQSISKATIPALMVAAIYFIGMNVVYLLTPNDLKWHLKKSVDRTMLPVAGCIFVAGYFILDVLEKNRQKTLGKI